MSNRPNEETEIFTRYAKLWASVTMFIASAIGVFLIFSGSIFHASSETATALAAIGESVIASVFIYITVSLFLDPVRQRAQARELAGYAIGVAQAQFQERFEASLPIAVYESSTTPKLDFRDAFAELIESSSRYDYKGPAAEFSTFRLAMGCQRREYRRLDQVRFCILNPSAMDSLRAHALLELKEKRQAATDALVDSGLEELRLNIFVSLVALYDIRDSLSTSIYLHRDLPFFRCEMFDGGMFLTYYLDDVKYPESLQFSRRTRPYKAYRASLDMTRTFPDKLIEFGISEQCIRTEMSFSGLLSELGCNISLQDLREFRDARFNRFRKLIRESGISETDIF